ncbi:MAG: YncE family protein [Flavobacteriaceae bacterium]|nr:YncE family protein [Flavobacteriaceae bacterium]
MSIKITTKFLPKGTVGKEYSCQLTAEVSPPTKIIWRTFNPLPSGLSLNSKTGLISGICKETFKGVLGIEIQSISPKQEASKMLSLIVTKSKPVNPPTINSFTADWISDDSDDLELVWDVENATEVYLQLLPAPLTTMTSGLIITPTPEYPILSRYTLVATNESGSVTSTIETTSLEEVENSPVAAGYLPMAVAESYAVSGVFVGSSIDDGNFIGLNSKTLSPMPNSPAPLSHSWSIAVSYDGLQVFSTAGFNVMVLDAKTLTNVQGSPFSTVGDARILALSHDLPDSSYGSRLYVVSQIEMTPNNMNRMYLQVFDANTFEEILSKKLLEETPSSIIVSNDGARIYLTNGYSDTVTVLSSDTLDPIPESPILVGKRPCATGFSPCGSLVYVGNQDSSSITILEAKTLQPTRSAVTVEFKPYDLVVSPDGLRIYTANGSFNSVTMLSSETLKGSTFPAGSQTLEVCASRDGSRIYATNYTDNTLSVFRPVLEL